MQVIRLLPSNGQVLSAVVLETDPPPRHGKASLPVAHAIHSETNQPTRFTLFVQHLPADAKIGDTISIQVVKVDRDNPPRWAFVDWKINAVLSGGNIRFDTPEFMAKETGVRRIRALSEYFVRFLQLRMESLPLTARVRVAGSTVNMPLEYSEALKRAGELRLKTLDLPHLAYAGLISNLRTKIDNFVTADSDILDRHFIAVIEQQFGFNAAHPKDAKV